jgi:hypothetical protein
MGAGKWDSGAYTRAADARRAAGAHDFGYDATMRSVSRDRRRAAPALDPYEVTVREARDSDEHPASTPIAILFDVTGSMGQVPPTLQRRLPDLLGLLRRGRYAEDPQVMVGAVGDDQYDSVPLQVGQFESDNRIDEQLRDVYIEGGGGGDRCEGYALAAYFLATRARLDAVERRGRKGYVFLIGDEANKPRLLVESVRRFVGDDLDEDLDVASVYRQLQERFHVFFVVPNLTSYYGAPWLEAHWRPIVGERFLQLDDPDAVCELIALTVGVTEQAVTLDEGLADLAATGGDADGAAVGKALAGLGAGRGDLRAAGTGHGDGGVLPDDL